MSWFLTDITCTSFFSLGLRLEAERVRSFQDWWLNPHKNHCNFKGVEVSLVCWLLWYIWKQRNAVIFNHENPNPVNVIDAAMKSNAEYWSKVPQSRIPMSVGRPTRQGPRWSRPPTGVLKINSDGAYKFQHTEAGIGIICRNEHVSFCWGFVDKVKSISAFMTEALALRRALMLAIDMGHDKVIFETNSQMLVNCVSRQQPDLYEWRCRSIIQDIINFLMSKAGFSFIFAFRDGNSAADHLADVAYKGVCPAGWVHQPSLALNTILALDMQEASNFSEDASRPVAHEVPA